MKKKYIIINVFLALAVLFPILFQSVHSYEHHSEQLKEKHCDHHYSKIRTEVTHAHKSVEKCFVCDFHFSSFTSSDFFVFRFDKNNPVKALSSFFTQQHSSFFKGCLFSLRAPPVF